MIRSGMVIKHNNAMDTAFLVLKAFGPFGTEGYHKLKGEWINMGFVKSFPIGVRETIEIKQQDLSNWKHCLDVSTSDCIRYAQWVKIP